MNRENQVKVLLLATLAGAGLLYWATAAEGYPWSASTHWALAWSGVLGKLPRMAHPVWGYFVQVFDGHYIAMSATFAAFACALAAAVVTWHFGWRIGAAAALVSMFLPRVWNAAVTGERFAALLFAAVAAFIFADFCCVSPWLRSLRVDKRQVDGETTLAAVEAGKKRRKLRRIAAWAALGVSVIFALTSLTLHDYSIGEDATEYAEGVLKDAKGKWVVLSGVADDQFYAAVRDGGHDVVLVSLRRDDIYRRELIRRVRTAFPGEAALLAAAEVSPQEFVSVARKAHPDLFVMADMDRTRTMIEKSGHADVLKRRALPIEKLVGWNNEMVRAMDAGDVKTAGAIAREILSQPKWRGFVPANAILGTLSGMEGDFVASERFFRTVFASDAEKPVVAYNDFAETLRQLKKYEEAETYARKAVGASGPQNWMARLTLAQILTDADRNPDLVRKLLHESLPYVPHAAKLKFQQLLSGLRK